MKAFRYAVILLLCAFAVAAIAGAQQTVAAAARALQLWATAVVPALFPFFIASRALLLMGCAPLCSRALAPLMRFLGYPQSGAYALAVSMLGGYPGGAKAVSELLEQGAVSQKEAEHLSILCHTSGPLFVMGTAAGVLLKQPQWGVAMLMCHYCACFCTAALFAFGQKPSCEEARIMPQGQPLSVGAVMGQSVMAGVNTMLLICGYMVFFGVVIALLPLPEGNVGAVLAGMLEMTNGIAHLSGSQAMPLACALLSFSGVCINLQALTLLGKACRPLPFVGARLICAVFASALAALFQVGGNVLYPVACAAAFIAACRLFGKLFA